MSEGISSMLSYILGKECCRGGNVEAIELWKVGGRGITMEKEASGETNQSRFAPAWPNAQSPQECDVRRK